MSKPQMELLGATVIYYDADEGETPAIVRSVNRDGTANLAVMPSDWASPPTLQMFSCIAEGTEPGTWRRRKCL